MADLPEGHKRLKVEDLNDFSLHEGALYWKGQKIKAEFELSSLFQKRLAKIGAAFAALLLLLNILSAGFQIYDRLFPPAKANATSSTVAQPTQAPPNPH